MKKEAIIHVGAEGGSLTLWGRRVRGGWEFAREVIDQSWAFLDEDDAPPRPPKRRLVWLRDWDAALAAFDRYPWAMLHAVAVHPEFVEQVRAAVAARLDDARSAHAKHQRARWNALLARGAEAAGPSAPGRR